MIKERIVSAVKIISGVLVVLAFSLSLGLNLDLPDRFATDKSASGAVDLTTVIPDQSTDLQREPRELTVLPSWFEQPALTAKVPVLAQPAAGENITAAAEDTAAPTALPTWFQAGSLPDTSPVIEASQPPASSEPVLSQETPAADVLNAQESALPGWFLSVPPAVSSADTWNWDGHHTIYPAAVVVTPPTIIRHGDRVTYTVVAINDNVATPNVWITSTMPEGFTPRTISQNFGTVAADGVITLTAAYDVDRFALSGMNVVTLTQDGGVPAILKVTPFVVVPGIWASSINVSGPTSINNCDTVTYTVALTNTGSLTVTNGIVFTTTMPVGFSPLQRRVEVGSLLPGEVFTTSLVYQASCSSVSGQHQLSLVQEGYETPIIKRSGFVVKPGAITVSVLPGVIQAYVGEVVTWTVLVENVGYGDVSNLVVTDTLGSGLSLVGGSLVHSYDRVAAGQTVSFQVAVRVESCSGLDNQVHAVWGCDVCQQQTADASVDLQVDNPVLSYTPPVINLDYCANLSNVTMSIQNTGVGKAHEAFIGVDLNGFTVNSTSAGSRYSTSRRGFVITDTIPAGGTYVLTYTLSFPNACASADSGTLLYQPLYRDDCGNPYSFPVKSGSWTRSGEASLSVDVFMASEIQLGQILTATVSGAGSNLEDTLYVTQTVPAGWNVLNQDGGQIVSTGVVTYLVWTIVPTQSLTAFVYHPTFNTPSDASGNACLACGQSISTSVVGRSGDCQGCQRSASDFATTAVQCGLGVASEKKVAPATNESCSTYVYTNTYTFPAEFTTAIPWSSMILTETMQNSQVYVPGSLHAYIISGTEEIALSATPRIVNSKLVVDFEDGTVMPPGKKLVVAYDLTTTAGSLSACSGYTWFDWTYFKLGTTNSSVCGGVGLINEGVYVSSTPPQMSVSVSGLPTTVSSCGVYTVTLNATRNTSIPAYDVVLDMNTDIYAIIDVVGYTGAVPITTTQDAGGYHFYYGDKFATAATASVSLRVQLRCNSVSAPLSARISYDNKCQNDDIYKGVNYCSAGGSLAQPVVLTPKLILYKFPEVIFASGDFVTWTLTAINSGSGTAYGVTLTDTLGAGLGYARSTIASTQNSVAGAVPITSTHVVTWANLTIKPGEMVTVRYTGEIIGCSDFTNKFEGSVGCQGETCQTGTSVNSVVKIPGTQLLNTNNTLETIPTCSTAVVTATVKNAGLLSVYNAIVTETLPSGLTYVTGSSEYVVGSGATPPTTGWSATLLEPEVNNRVLSWDTNQIANLARIYPKQTIWIRFSVKASCYAITAIQTQSSYSNISPDTVYNKSISGVLPFGYVYNSGTSEYYVGSGPNATGGWVTAAGNPALVSGSLIWTKSQIPVLATVYPTQTVWVRYSIKSDLYFVGGLMTVNAYYEDTCTSHTSTASSFLVDARPPVVTAVSQGKNVTRNTPYAGLVYAEPGNTIVWKLTLGNSSTTPAFNTVVTNVLPANVNYVASSIAPAERNGQELSWNVGQLNQTTWTAYITTTVTDVGCLVADAPNLMTAAWGCDDGCRVTTAALSSLRTRPRFQAAVFSTGLGAQTINRCGDVITVTLLNDGPTAFDVVLTDVLPTGFVYQETVYASTAPTMPVAGAASPVWSWASLPSGATTLAFKVNSGTANTCAVTPTGNNNKVTLQYDDTCETTIPYTITTTTKMNVVSPNLVAGITPATRTAQENEVITWTVAVTNTGAGIAYNVAITDVLASGFELIDVSQGVYSGGTTDPITTTNISWRPIFNLGPGKSWRATVTARAITAGGHLNQLIVKGNCAAGCLYASTSKNAYVSMVESFVKSPLVQTQTIGSQTIFNISAGLPGDIVTYTQVVVTDTLPAGLQYVGATLTALLNTDYTTPTQIVRTPTVSGNTLTWTLGDLTGRAEIVAVITTTVKDILDNQTGTQMINKSTLRYLDTGQAYKLTASAQVNLVEPKLDVSKTVIPTTLPTSGVGAGDLLTYTVVISNSGGSTAYESVFTDTLPAGVELVAGSVHATQPVTYTYAANILQIQGSPAGSLDIGVGASVRVTYTAQVQPEILILGAYTNTVDADWTSLNGSSASERAYQDQITYTVDGAQDTAQALFYVNGVDFAKTDHGTTTATIGDVVTYTLQITSPLGTVRSLALTDTLPSGLGYNLNSVNYLGISAPAAFSQTGQVLTWTWEPTGTVISHYPALITFTVTVLNDAANNRQGNTKVNQAVLAYANAAGQAQTPLNSTAGLTIVEPQITTGKVVTPLSGVQAGSLLTYTVSFTNTGNSPAYDVTGLDVLAQGVVFSELKWCKRLPQDSAVLSQVTTSGADKLFDAAAAGGWDILAGESILCQYTSTAQNSLVINGTHTNTIDADWSTQDGTSNTNERNYTDSGSYTWVDGTQDSDLASFTVNALTFDKAANLTSVRVGETIYYTLTVTSPKGTIDNLTISDVLPQGYKYNNDLSFSGISTTTVGVSSPNDGSAAVTLSLTQWDAVVTSVPAKITYTAKVMNNSFTNRGNTKTNTASLNYLNVAGTTVSLSDTTTETVVEPGVTITKDTVPGTISPAPDAGDLLKYRITINNPGGTNYSTAYNVRITDTLPADVDLLTVTVTSSASWVDSSNLTSDLLDVLIDSIANGSSVTIDLDVRLRSSVQPNTTIANTGYVTWTSMPGVVTGERTGSTADEGGSANDYRANASDSFNTATVALSKIIASTSEAGTAVCVGGVGACSSPWRAAIGEVVRYRLVAEIPEGTSTNLQLQDLLASNLGFINDGTAKFGFVSASGASYVSDAYGGILSIGAGCGVVGSVGDALPCGLADENLSSSSTTNNDSYESGVDPYFKLGTFHNNDSDADKEYIVVEFNAVVENTAINQAFTNSTGEASPTLVSNNFRVYVDAVQKGVDSTSSSSNQLYIAEPVIRNLTKARVGSGGLDAGDLVTYTLKFSNSAAGSDAAAAYDLQVLDTLDSNLTKESVTWSVPAGVVVTDTSTSGAIQVALSKLEAGASGTLTVTVRVAAFAPNGMTITNTASLSYTSLPGTNGTGWAAPGSAGTQTGERIGTSGVNDYTSAAGTVNVTLNTPTVDKQSPSPTSYTIGDLVTYDIQVTLPEGQTRGLVVSDYVVPGLAVDSYSIVTSGYTGNVGSLSPTVSPLSLPGTSGTDLVLTFPTITTTNNNITTDNTFILRVNLRVLNLSTTERGNTFGNTADIRYTNPNTSLPVTVTDSSLPANITIIEPQITTGKVVTPLSGVQAGSLLTYTVSFTNTGNSPAYDVTALDVLAQGVAFTELKWCKRLPQDSVVLSQVTASGADRLFDAAAAGGWDILVGESIRCQYTGTAQNRPGDQRDAYQHDRRRLEYPGRDRQQSRADVCGQRHGLYLGGWHAGHRYRQLHSQCADI